MSRKGTQKQESNLNTQDDSNYKRTIEEIKKVLDKAAPKEVKSDSDIERDKHLKDNISKRDDDVTLLLNRFVTEHNLKIQDDKKLKKKFFKILFWFALGIGLLIISAIILVFIRPLQIENLISLLGVVFSFLGSTLFIVKMLLNYLFPIDSDKNIISLISTIINHDLSQYQHLRNISQQDKDNNKDNKNSK